MPASGDGVAESVQASRGIEGGAIGGSEYDAGSADGGADGSGAGDAHADCSGGLVSGASDDGSSGAKACGFGSGGGNFSADVRGFEERGQQIFADVRFAEDFFRPAAVGHVEKKRAGCVGHVDGAIAGEAEADVILRQHDVGDALPIFRFSLAHPEKLGEREICERRIAGEADQTFAAEHFFELARLRFAALVAPDDGGADDFVRGIEQDRAVHLSREADAGDVFGLDAGRLQRLAD